MVVSGPMPPMMPMVFMLHPRRGLLSDRRPRIALFSLDCAPTARRPCGENVRLWPFCKETREETLPLANALDFERRCLRRLLESPQSLCNLLRKSRDDLTAAFPDAACESDRQWKEHDDHEDRAHNERFLRRSLPDDPRRVDDCTGNSSGLGNLSVGVGNSLINVRNARVDSRDSLFDASAP